MRICRVQIDSLATPVLALACDGALYDVGALESALGREPLADFHGRVFAARAAGLAALDAGLRAGRRPTEARILNEEALCLPPCDEARASLVTVALYGDRARAVRSDGGPPFELGTARTLGPCELPLPVGASGPVRVTGGLAAILGDEFTHGSARDAERAILGYALHLSAQGVERPLACGELGPALVTPDELGPLDGLRLELSGAGAGTAGASVTSWRTHLFEAVAYVSSHLPLRPGDIVSALGAVSLDLAPGGSVTLSCTRLGRLSAALVAGPRATNWRLA